MKNNFIAALLGALAFCAAAGAAPDLGTKQPTAPEQAPRPRPSEVTALTAYPKEIALKGGDSGQQLVVTATLADGRVVDLTAHALYDAADGKIIRVTSTGRVMPLLDGKTEITASYGDKSVKVLVATEAIRETLPINFANQVVPIFTKLGCNSGGCHGKITGQNGFRLSLLGFEPELDFATLVNEDRGRRSDQPHEHQHWRVRSFHFSRCRRRKPNSVPRGPPGRSRLARHRCRQGGRARG